MTFADVYEQTFIRPDAPADPPGMALAWDGHRLEDLPGVTAELLEQLEAAQDDAERRRAPMPTLRGWYAGGFGPSADQSIDLWPVAS